MKVKANDTFCLYLGWVLCVLGFLMLVIGVSEPKVLPMGIGIQLLGIASQLMAFQDKGE